MPADLIDQLTSDPDFLSLSPTEQDQMYEELSRRSKPSIAFVPGYQQAEEAIANRGSGIGFLRAAAHDPSLISRHPFLTGLSVLGLPLETFETTGANTALALQRGEQQSINRDVLAGLQGERPAQFGDVFRSVNIPKPIASVLGLTLMPGGAQLEKALGKSGIGLAQKGLGRIPQAGRNVIQFLKGNPQGIQTATSDLQSALKQSAKQLDSDAYDVVTSYRRGGSEHGGFFKRHGQLSDEAWEPVKQVARGVTNPIPVDELKSTISAQYADDAAFAQKAHLQLDDLFQEPTTSAENLIQKLTNLQQGVRASVNRGVVPRDAGEQLIAAIRSAAAQAIESNAPEDLKGLYQEGLDNWASHAADTRHLFRILRPGAAMEEPTAEGVNFIKKAVTGGFDADRDTQEFIGRVKSRYGIDLPSSVTKSGQQIQQAEDALRQAKQVGARGVLVLREVLPRILTALGLGALYRATKR